MIYVYKNRENNQIFGKFYVINLVINKMYKFYRSINVENEMNNLSNFKQLVFVIKIVKRNKCIDLKDEFIETFN